MKESPHPTPTGEPEETLVTPRFDEVETVQAQPVVPLDEVPARAPRGRSYGVRRYASLPVALVLVSALVGVVVGGAGLYFYQHRSAQDSAADTQPTSAPAEAPPAAEVSTTAPVQESTPAPADEVTDAAEVVSAEVVEPDTADDDAKKKEAEKTPAPETRKAAERDDDDNDTASTKRGKKAEHEAEAVRRTPRAERVASREQARDDDDGEPEARLSDEIIYRRERRAERQAQRRERRANRQRSVDRVRGIFEGQPE